MNRVPIRSLKPGDKFKALFGSAYEGRVVSIDESGFAATVEVKRVDSPSIKSFFTGDGEQVIFATGWERTQWSCGTEVYPA